MELSSVIFILVLQNCLIRIKYSFDAMFFQRVHILVLEGFIAAKIIQKGNNFLILIMIY